MTKVGIWGQELIFVRHSRKGNKPVRRNRGEKDEVI